MFFTLRSTDAIEASTEIEEPEGIWASVTSDDATGAVWISIVRRSGKKKRRSHPTHQPPRVTGNG